MSTPVTRGEMQAEFAQFEIRLEQRLAQLATKAELAQLATKAELAQLATKVELEIWGGALLARIASGEQRLLDRMIERIDASEQRLLMELARHTRAIQETLSGQISIVDEKYADLPARVSRLETKVFAPKQR